MGWVKVVFTLEKIRKAFDLPNRAWLRAQQRSYPKEFILFSGFEFGKSIEDIRFVLYFTPKAADDCEDILMEYQTEPCSEPDRNAPYFGIAYKSEPPTPTLDFTNDPAN